MATCRCPLVYLQCKFYIDPLNWQGLRYRLYNVRSVMATLEENVKHISDAHLKSVADDEAFKSKLAEANMNSAVRVPACICIVHAVALLTCSNASLRITLLTNLSACDSMGLRSMCMRFLRNLADTTRRTVRAHFRTSQVMLLSSAGSRRGRSGRQLSGRQHVRTRLGPARRAGSATTRSAGSSHARCKEVAQMMMKMN